MSEQINPEKVIVRLLQDKSTGRGITQYVRGSVSLAIGTNEAKPTHIHIQTTDRQEKSSESIGKFTAYVEREHALINISFPDGQLWSGTAADLQVYLTTANKFPNGFDSWMETHHEVVTHLAITADNAGSIAYNAREERGTGGLYEIAEELTNEFEQANKGRVWDGDFFEAIEDFLTKKDNITPVQVADEDFCINISWGVQDVIQEAADNEIELSVSDAKAILLRIEKHHDASVGINWENIMFHVNDYITDKNQN